MKALSPRAVLAAALFAGSLAAQPERPLMSLPYTPSLEAKFMDRAVDPCTDFYRFSCGNWIRQNPIPADQAVWNVYMKLGDENHRYLWGLLEEAARPEPGRNPNQQRIGDYFQSCMDESAVEKAGAAPLRKDLDAIGALRSASQLPSLIARLQLETRGESMLFGFGSNQDFADSSRVIAFADAGGLGLPDRDYYLKDDAKSRETRAKYLEHVRKMLELLGDTPAAAAKGAGTVMAIETALAKASLTRVERRDPYKLFHKYTRNQLVALTPAFKWGEHLAAAGMPSLAEFNVTQPAFYKELNAQLKSRPLTDWKVYLRWHLVHARARYLSSAFERADFDFYSSHLRGVKEMKPRWKRCVEYVDRDLGEALAQEFVRKTFTPDTKARALAMTHEIQKAMEQDLHDLPWMGEETRKQALAKLHGMVDKIGYPEKWRDYTSLEVVRGDFAGNVNRATVFESRRQLAKIGKPLDRGEWQMTPPTVNAYYDPQMNDINFPAGVLQPPLFDPKTDDAPNYGNTGGTIGHELTHGFDDEGRQFDAKGNLKDWWTKTDAAEFEKRAACISDQYSHYTIVDDIKINGKLTLGEDTADLGGELLAYIAWKNATRGQDLKTVDGLTPDQRFFVGFAQWACGDERVENKRLSAITNPHSPDEYRINGVVSNMPEFRNAFACKAGQPMVREPVCRVW
jgi:putative endopeptidase